MKRKRNRPGETRRAGFESVHEHAQCSQTCGNTVHFFGRDPGRVAVSGPTAQDFRKIFRSKEKRTADRRRIGKLRKILLGFGIFTRACADIIQVFRGPDDTPRANGDGTITEPLPSDPGTMGHHV